MVLRGRLTPEVGALLVKALDAARETLYQRHRTAKTDSATDPSAQPPTRAQQRADALALIAEVALHHELDPGAPGERYQVVVHVDAPVLADPDQPGQSVLEDGGRVSAGTSRRLACDASRVVMRDDEDGALWRSAPGPGRFPRRYGVRCTIETGGVAFQAVGCRSARAITYATGRKADPRRSRTSRCCVAGTTEQSTRRDTRSIDTKTARFSSGGPTVGSYRTCHPPP